MATGKKTLLNEGTIRRFMKLAELDTLSSNFLNEYELEEERDDEGRTPEEEAFAVADTDEGEVEGFEAGVEAAEEATPQDMVQDLVTQIADVISNVTGVEVSVEGEEGAPEDVEGMEDLEDLAADEEVLDMGEPDMPGDELAEQESEDTDELEEDSKKDEYRRQQGPGGIEHRAGRGVGGHFKGYEGPPGGNKGDKPTSHPRRKRRDYEPAQQEESVQLDHVDLIDDEALVQEIAQRVAQRLMKK